MISVPIWTSKMCKFAISNVSTGSESNEHGCGTREKPYGLHKCRFSDLPSTTCFWIPLTLH